MGISLEEDPPKLSPEITCSPSQLLENSLEEPLGSSWIPYQQKL